MLFDLRSMQKRGVSGIVTTVLLILIVLVGISIVWAALRPFVNSVDDFQSESSGSCLANSIEIVRCVINQTGNSIAVQVKRGPAENSLEGLRFLFSTGEFSSSFDVASVPNPLETRTYTFMNDSLINTRTVNVISIINGKSCPLATAPVICSLGIVEKILPRAGSPTCSDGVDNDADGVHDYPADPGCDDSEDLTEDDALPRTISYAYSWNDINETLTSLIPIYWIDDSHYWLNGILPGDPRVVEGFLNATARMPVGHRVIGIDNSIKANLYRNPRSPYFEALWEEDACRDASGAIVRNASGFPYQCLWPDHGISLSQGNISLFLSEYTALPNAPDIDIAVLDYEGGLYINNGTEWGYVVEQDPRWASAAAVVGHSNLSYLLEAFYDTPLWRVWNQYLWDSRAEAINRSVYNPLVQYYPNITLSNWRISYNDPQYGFFEENGHYQSSDCSLGMYCSIGRHVGTHQSISLYTGLGQISNPRTVPLPGIDGAYNRTPFNNFKYDLNRLRVSQLSSDVPIQAWIAARGNHRSAHSFYPEYSLDDSLIYQDLYQERILHARVMGLDSFFYWGFGIFSTFSTPAEDQLLQDILLETDALIGFADREVLEPEMIPWGADYVLSGTRAAGRVVWRFTPDLDASGALLSARLIAENQSGVVFETTHSRITIPQGIIYRPENAVSQQGYWIIQPDGAPAPYNEQI